MRRLILFLMVGSRYLSYIGGEDVQWIKPSLVSAYREIQGPTNLSTILQIPWPASEQSVPINETGRRLPYFKTKGPTHACRNIG